MFTGPCSAASEERSAGESGSAIRRKDRVPRSVCTAMRGLSPLLALAAGLVLAAPAAAADHVITFASYAYSPTPATVKTGDTATFSGIQQPPAGVGQPATSPPRTRARPKAFSFSQPGTYSYYCQLHGDDAGHGRPLTVLADQHPARVSFGVSPLRAPASP